MSQGNHANVCVRVAGSTDISVLGDFRWRLCSGDAPERVPYEKQAFIEAFCSQLGNASSHDEITHFLAEASQRPCAQPKAMTGSIALRHTMTGMALASGLSSCVPLRLSLASRDWQSLTGMHRFLLVSRLVGTSPANAGAKVTRPRLPQTFYEQLGWQVAAGPAEAGQVRLELKRGNEPCA
jgi:hypothetical protein